MFHGMDVQNPVHVFRHLPLLAFVESYIYQVCCTCQYRMCVVLSSLDWVSVYWYLCLLLCSWTPWEHRSFESLCTSSSVVHDLGIVVGL